jgi:PAP2 superfamily
MPMSAVYSLRHWLSARHSLLAESALVLAGYLAYEVSRGLVAGGRSAAFAHAHTVVQVERSLHLFVERNVQHAALDVPGLVASLGFAYLSLHLLLTSSVLLWLHQRHREAFPLVRTTLLVASAIGLVGYLAFPTAPPRMAALGIEDTISGGHVDLNRGLVSSLYNPYAAVPSMHVGYALVVGASLFRYGRRRVARLAGAIYPPFILLVVVATGNHFLFDAGAGAAAAALGAALALALVPRPVRATARRAPSACSTARARATREDTSILRKMLCRWLSTVFWLRNSSAAICGSRSRHP